ncbi:hypothetical protein MUP37_06960, partial [Candidatus Bathyarchaeota archaeon]|nr:hypothetical protein [Candidatus Bathyarchaeota archaeon]
MSERELLMIPGPTNIDPSVMRAMMKTTESHMGEPFGTTYRRTLDKLKEVFMTQGEAFAISGSGTLAQEISLVNMTQPEDKRARFNLWLKKAMKQTQLQESTI